MNTIYGRSFFTFIVIGLLFLLGFPLAAFNDNKQGQATLNDKVVLPFSVDKKVEVILLYFGYVGCRTICVPSLQEIATIANDFNNSKKVGFYFINITKNGREANDFASFFHKNIYGLDLSKNDTSKMLADFRAYSSDSLTVDGEISHTGYLYLLTQNEQQEVRLKYMYYTRPFNEKSIVKDIKEELK